MRAALALFLILLSACTSTLVDYETRTHVVRPGETLYTIAFRYGVDYRALAAWNGIANPDLIFAGQRLSLRPASRAVAGRPASATRRPTAATAPPSTASARAAPRPSAASQRTGPRPPLGGPAPPALPPPAVWLWPTEGRVVSRFGASDGIASGIGIGGREGQAVNAAAAGRVVYAGSGLIGYGQLVIIEHNETYLTAYGHNSRLLVSQGETLRQGQKIAEMGLGPGRTPRLHFEIRRNGVPVDPLQYLP